MSDQANKRSKANKADPTDTTSADIPLPSDDDFALAALDFLSEAMGGDTSSVDTGVDDFFDVQQLSSMAAMQAQQKPDASDEPPKAGLDASLLGLAESMTQGVPSLADVSEAELLSLAESMTAPVPDLPAPTPAITKALADLPQIVDDSTDLSSALLDLAESMTSPVIDEAPPPSEPQPPISSQNRDTTPQPSDFADAALLNLAESLMGPTDSSSTDDPLRGLAEDSALALPDLSDVDFDDETLMIDLAESLTADLLGPTKKSDVPPATREIERPESAEILSSTTGDLLEDDLVGLAESALIADAATPIDAVPLPDLESELLDLADSAETPSEPEIPLPNLESVVADHPFDTIALAELALENTDASDLLTVPPQIELVDDSNIDAELEALAALEAGGDTLDIDAALEALMAAENQETAKAVGDADTNEQPSGPPQSTPLPPTDSIDTSTVQDTSTAHDAFVDDALNLLDDEPVDLNLPDLTTLAEETLAQLDAAGPTVDDLLLNTAESAVLAEDALSVLDGSSASLLELELLQGGQDDESATSDYLDMLVASIDAQLTTIQKQETLLDLSGDSDATGSVVEQLIIFTIGNGRYAIPVENVLEVGEPPIATTIPFVPRWVKGVFNMRGDILSLIDLRTYFDLDSPQTDNDEWMIVSQTSREDLTVGLLVDDIIGNRQMNRRDASDLTSDLDGKLAEYVARLYRQQDGLISVLDFDKLLNSAEMRQFEHV